MAQHQACILGVQRLRFNSYVSRSWNLTLLNEIESQNVVGQRDLSPSHDDDEQ